MWGSLSRRAGGDDAAAVAADTIDAILDQAQILRLPDRVGTIVVGNPLIADMTVQSGGPMVVTGKGYGRTNVIALDHHGGVLLEKSHPGARSAQWGRDRPRGRSGIL